MVSACLLGLDTRYNGISKKNQAVIDYLTEEKWTVIPVCPEQLAGLPTPRPATRFQKGDGDAVLQGSGIVMNSEQQIVNDAFIKGAEQVLQIAALNRCRVALFKERSPSCGVHQIYREGQIVSGQGVSTACLKRHRISVFSEDELARLDTIDAGEENK